MLDDFLPGFKLYILSQNFLNLSNVVRKFSLLEDIFAWSSGYDTKLHPVVKLLI